jgi:hypothetical protein
MHEKINLKLYFLKQNIHILIFLIKTRPILELKKIWNHALWTFLAQTMIFQSSTLISISGKENRDKIVGQAVSPTGPSLCGWSGPHAGPIEPR